MRGPPRRGEDADTLEAVTFAAAQKQECALSIGIVGRPAADTGEQGAVTAVRQCRRDADPWSYISTPTSLRRLSQ